MSRTSKREDEDDDRWYAEKREKPAERSSQRRMSRWIKQAKREQTDWFKNLTNSGRPLGV